MGYKLYKDHGFDEITEFLPSTEENKINIEGCIPLLLVINDIICLLCKREILTSY